MVAAREDTIVAAITTAAFDNGPPKKTPHRCGVWGEAL
jgi:hypothetical protein